VQKLGGLLFAYMGALPAPALPRWDVLAWDHGRRWIQKQELLNCNWMQCMENSVDPSHLYWLHGATAHLGKMGEYDEKHDFITFEFGIMKRRTTGVSTGGHGEVDQHPLLFPNILRHVLKTKNVKEGKVRHNLQFRIPVDDTHTQVYVVYFEPSETERTSPDADVPMDFLAVRNEEGKYRLEQVLVQDAMAWETQGPVMDRSREHLGTGDKGVVIFRKMLREQIDIVGRGGTPLGCLPKEQERPLIELDVINERIGVGAHKRVA
jgi:5,5'-dehydrodivanillate O-demethylase